uniref:Uncharacterized protein n=1 Tax=Rousettus aegyptiacus TaxID=9407 RepID=A0A7J8D6H0_ROUAE|nr:hypothetical protein HJG63_008753 [Rousettus aegyptiacus]
MPTHFLSKESAEQLLPLPSGPALPITEWDGVNRAKSEARHWSCLFQVEGGEELSLLRRPSSVLGSQLSGRKEMRPTPPLPITPHLIMCAKFSSNLANPARFGGLLRELLGKNSAGTQLSILH